MNNGLLAQIYSFGNTTRNKLRGLLDDPVGTLQQAADAAASGLNNLTGKQEVEQQFALRDRIQAGDKNALAEYKQLGDKFNEKMLSLALDSNPAAVGMTAWHGSPHKFDKFDLSKIGTGEGAQAYGHGMYLAESQKVGQEYADSLGSTQFYANGNPLSGDAAWAAMHMADNGGKVKDVLEWAKTSLKPTPEGRKAAATLVKEARKLRGANITEGTGNLYKTDIPDEAVARFLDWDKPLSQQAEILDALKKAGYGRTDTPGVTGAYYAPKTNEEIENLKQAGIYGLRYLDGGSRAAGQGSSNFVVFDPDIIRILERNGQATGAQPWKPGEWGGLLK